MNSCQPERGAPNSQASACRGGFTLLELMLVLVLIVVIGSIAVPQISEVFERQKLKGAADQLRMKWDRTRLEAMRTGQAQVFQCTVDTRDYTIKPLILQSDATDAGVGATVMVGGSVVEKEQAGYFSAADSEEENAEQLEEKISFVSCLVAGNMRAYSIAQEAQSTSLGDVTTQTIAHQVIFYPDGSSSTAQVQLKNERGDVQAVEIRGLTGYSRVVEISNAPTKTDE